MRKRICPAFWPGTCTTGCKYPAANGTQGTCKLLVSRCLLPSPVTFILKFLLGLSGPGYLFAPRPLQSWVHSPSPFFFFSSSVSLLTPSTLEGGARSNYQETQHSNFQEKCDQGGRWILSVSGISSICNANVSLSCLTAAVKHRSSGGGYLWQAITSTRPECPEYSNY